MLKFYDPRAEVTLQCDASEYGLGATLLQGGQPVAFASRTFSRTERNYAQLEKEGLAIVFGCQRFDQYLARKRQDCRRNGSQATTAHIQEAYSRSAMSCAMPYLQRMLLRLLRYNLDVIYKKGSLMFKCTQKSWRA